MKTIKLRIDQLPPTDNNLYGQTGRRRFMYNKGKEWKEYAIWTAMSQYKGEPLRDDIEATVKFFLKRDRDIHGSLKLIWDCLENVCYENDKQIVVEHLYKEKGCDNSYLLVEIKGLD